MNEHDEQLKRFRYAVERKAEAAEDASHKRTPRPDLMTWAGPRRLTCPASRATARTR
jgi:hypothetical protein